MECESRWLIANLHPKHDIGIDDRQLSHDKGDKIKGTLSEVLLVWMTRQYEWMMNLMLWLSLYDCGNENEIKHIKLILTSIQLTPTVARPWWTHNSFAVLPPTYSATKSYSYHDSVTIWATICRSKTINPNSNPIQPAQPNPIQPNPTQSNPIQPNPIQIINGRPDTLTCQQISNHNQVGKWREYHVPNISPKAQHSMTISQHLVHGNWRQSYSVIINESIHQLNYSLIVNHGMGNGEGEWSYRLTIWTCS